MATNITQKDKDVIKRVEEQAKTTSTLPEDTKIKSVDQEVQSDELLDSVQIGDPIKIAVPDPTETIDVSTPEKFDVAKYEAAEAAPKLGEAKAAKGEPSEGAIMEAAQGELSLTLLPPLLLKNLIPEQQLNINLHSFLRA